MPRSPACIDANIVVKMVAPEADRPQALALWDGLLRQGVNCVAPYLFRFEVTSALWRKVMRGFLTATEAREALETALGMGVEFLDPPDLSLHAFDLAVKFNLPAAYDAHYLALAEALDCEFWTADERLFRTIRDDFTRIRWLGDHRAKGQ